MKNRTLRAAVGAALLVSCNVMAADAPAATCPLCGPIDEVSEAQPKSDAVRRLQDSFREHVGTGRITGCSLVLSTRFGEGFSAVGGHSDVVIGKKKSQWMICSDNGVGNFAAVIGARWWQTPRQYLADLLQANCVGG